MQSTAKVEASTTFNLIQEEHFVSLEKAGLDFAHKDDSVRIQDDLYRHFNGQWLKTAVIPADRATDGAFIKLRIQSEERVREIIGNSLVPHRRSKESADHGRCPGQGQK